MRIAIIGTGIAGLGAGYALCREHDVVLFERNDYPGGHTNTVDVPAGDRLIPIDTGFIVHNEQNYPQLLRLFAELGIRTQESEMSFSVTCERCRLEYSGRRPFAQPSNIVRPGFVRMFRDVLRFLRTARSVLGQPGVDELTLAALVARQGYSREFRDHFLVPLTAAIWSTAPAQALDFPAAYALRFFDNHAMLGFGRFRWRTVVGGSREYVRALVERIGADRFRLGTEVAALARVDDGVEIRTRGGDLLGFDRAVVATHAPQALALLADPTADERRILGAFATTRNPTVLHTDERLLPRTRSARASWNFHVADCRAPAAKPRITYYANRLQRLDEPAHYCVTLNRDEDIREETVLRRIEYDHPLYTFASLRAQAGLPALNTHATAYCGAYHGYGFHEDGLQSGLAAAAALGVSG